ncbi:MAG: hypothetical protein AABY22_13340 [Nanoarchaeota archaeon]
MTRKIKYSYLYNYEWLYNQYVVLRKSCKQIAEENNIKQSNNVLYVLKKFNIERSRRGIKRKSRYLYGYNWIYNEYVTLKKSISQIAKEINSSSAIIHRVINKYKLTRTRIEALNLRKGYKMSEETKRKIGLGNKGKKVSKEVLEIRRKIMKEKWTNLEYRKHMSEVHKGQSNIFRGLTKETDIRLKEKGERNRGEKRYNWKGDKVSYSSLHDYIKCYLKKSNRCQNCELETNKLDLANVSGEYKRDLSDWEWLCRKCHVIKDRNRISTTKFRLIIKEINNRRKEYKNLHNYVRRNLLSPDRCQLCNEKRELHCSNKSGRYMRDLSDWWYLCPECHKNYDKNNIDITPQKQLIINTK